MRTLFGNLCSAQIFRHDEEMRAHQADKDDQDDTQQTQATNQSSTQELLGPTLLQLTISRKANSDPYERSALHHRLADQALKPPSKMSYNLKDSSKVLGQEPTAIIVTGDREVTHGSRYESLAHTPPLRVPLDEFIITPGSASQSGRRKAIQELNKSEQKRPRLECSEPELSDMHHEATAMIAITPVGVDLSPSSQVFHHHSTPNDGESSISSDEYFSSSNMSQEYSDSDQEPFETPLIFEDSVDQVFRCAICGHEVWSEIKGFCTACESGTRSIPYWEILEPETHRPTFEPNDTDEGCACEPPDIDQICEPYLDCCSSAYDSQDDDLKFTEEYEIDSFIDDEPHDDPIEEDELETSSDIEVDYEDKFRHLEVSHDALENVYHNILSRYNILCNEYNRLLGSGLWPGTGRSQSSPSEAENATSTLLTSDGIVHPPAPDSYLEDHDVSNGHSLCRLCPEVGPHVADDTSDANVIGTNQDLDWGNTTLVSTQDNHTEMEIEL
jgi:hypothetical protein